MNRILLALAIVLPLALDVRAVEREPVAEDQDAYVPREGATRLGYESESKLKSESAAKSFFYLSNDMPWPEKKEIFAEPKPAPRIPPKPQAKPEVEPAAEEETPRPRKPAPTAGDTTGADAAQSAAPATKPKSRKAAAEPAAAPAKKPRAAKKAIALPDIEEILADVRRAAEPQMPADRAPSASAASAPAQTYSSEVIGSVDMDQLAQDLANFQAQEAGPKKKSESKPEEPAADNWWVMTSVVSGTAAAVVLAVVLARRLRRRPGRIRSQSQIDSETRAFFAKLAEERRRVAPARPEPPKTPAPNRPRDEEELAAAFSEAPVEEPPTAAPAEESREPTVFLLPPELDNETYKDVIRLAAEGEPAETIAGRLNLGEGEVRLVLDLARLSHERSAAS